MQKIREMLSEIDHIAEGSYLHNDRSDIVTCLEDTRVDALATIKTWVERADHNRPRILWLGSMAGLGRSEISRSIVECTKMRGMLSADFSFSLDVIRESPRPCSLRLRIGWPALTTYSIATRGRPNWQFRHPVGAAVSVQRPWPASDR